MVQAKRGEGRKPEKTKKSGFVTVAKAKKIQKHSNQRCVSRIELLFAVGYI
jgi:hypothetical protein